jgi:signal transduction histidine kinase
MIPGMRPSPANDTAATRPPPGGRKHPPPLLGRPELKLALFFVLVASTWVAWADLMFVNILRIPVESMLIHTFKGVNVAATTGVLFYVFLRRAYDGWRRSEDERLTEMAAATARFRNLSSRIQTLREEERTSISREVHDELGQLLTGLKLKVRMVENHLDQSADSTLNPVIEELVEAGNIIDETINSVRRIATGLRPSTLDHLGLATALQQEADEFSRRTRIACELDLGRLANPVAEDLATAAFRVCQEALTNVTRHSGATRVTITCETSGRELILQVRDNGTGCNPDILADPRALGMLGMRERALDLHGGLEVTSAPGSGTTVILRLPLSANPQPDTTHENPAG